MRGTRMRKRKMSAEERADALRKSILDFRAMGMSEEIISDYETQLKNILGSTYMACGICFLPYLIKDLENCGKLGLICNKCKEDMLRE
jgi:hypothetical protein